MNTRPVIIVLGALIAVLLFFNGLAIVLLLQQRTEIESLRTQLAARTTSGESPRAAKQARARPPVSDAAVAPRKFTPKEEAEAAERRDFLQQHFAKFPVITFQPATNSESVIQRFRINNHIVGKIRLERYTAFRFTVPEWIDGDFEWMFISLTKAETDRRQRVFWYIVPEQGDMEGFTGYDLKPLTDYPRLKERFPNSSEVWTQTLSRQSLQPGQSYAIWFSYSDVKVPEVALAMTINSARGRKEFGTLPLK
jgi:hypothetical protein